jgi:hypothetical protein
MIDVLSMMKYWVTWPPLHKIEVAKSGYKAPAAKRGRFEQSDVEKRAAFGLTAKPGTRIVLMPGAPTANVVPYAKLPAYVTEALMKGEPNGGRSKDRNAS